MVYYLKNTAFEVLIFFWQLSILSALYIFIHSAIVYCGYINLFTLIYIIIIISINYDTTFMIVPCALVVWVRAITIFIN